MTICWQGNDLWIMTLPVDAMGRLACCAPQGREETEVLAALLAGVRVLVPREGLEYRQYRKSAPLGMYRRCLALERKLREMGVIVVRNGGGQPLGHEKGGAAGWPGISPGTPGRG